MPFACHGRAHLCDLGARARAARRVQITARPACSPSHRFAGEYIKTWRRRCAPVTMLTRQRQYQGATAPPPTHPWHRAGSPSICALAGRASPLHCRHS